MEKLIITLVAIVSILGSALFVYTITDNTLTEQTQVIENADAKTVVNTKKSKEPKSDLNGNYLLWMGNKYINTYSDEEALKSYVANEENSYVTVKGSGIPVFEQNKQYIVKTTNGKKQYGEINEALEYARKNKSKEAVVYFASNNRVIWSYDDKVKNNVTINVEKIAQNPELPNGSEVTALAMLLKAGGVEVEKLELARNVNIDNSELGSPYYGFVGDMYTEGESYGVYNQPIFKLLQSYIFDYCVNISGCDFSLVERFLDMGYPVWVITTENFKYLEESDFETYTTDFGDVRVTTKSQGVLITGYNSSFVFINDPMGNADKVNRQSFISSFEQMGNQAITYTVQ